MNIKRHTLKPICAILAFSTVFSSLLAADATEVFISESPMDGADTTEGGWSVDESRLEEIEVTYKQSSSYAVTIPKTIALDTKKQGTYSVKVTGDIDATQRVYVAPGDGIPGTENLDFYMRDQTPDSKKADVVATVTQSKFSWDSAEVANGYEETNNNISAPGLTAGTWKGTFQMEINLQTMAEHEHNYVDGICDGCGAIDPDHTHNYEDGKCTICGKETDPYEVAPANAYSRWDYTLDTENDIITLNYYKGAETDVIVYANYVVGGKTYKTRLASNDNGNVLTKYMFNGKETNSPNQNIISIKFSKDIDTSNVTSMAFMFNLCKSLTNLDISGFDTSNVTNMQNLFAGCSSLTSLDVSNFDTSKVTNMDGMFNALHTLTSLDVSSLDTSNVTSMDGTFYQCKALTNLDVSNFDTGKVTNMYDMFSGCTGLTNLDVSNFDTSNVINMGYMFYNCNSLTSLNLSGFDTSNVTNMVSMFDSNKSLTTLDLSSFDTSKVTNMNKMFYVSTNLKTIYATSGKWITSQATTTNMFQNCGTSSVTYK